MSLIKGDLKNLNSDNNLNFVFAPINIGAAKQGIIDDCFINFYVERSGKEIDLTYVGNVAIGEKYSTNSNTPLFIDSNFLEWKKLVDGIHGNGSQAGVQLGCRYYANPALRKNTLQTQANYVEETSAFIEQLEVVEVKEIIDGFVSKSLIASQLGFDWIQLHAAHGYFLSLMLSPEINKRKDQYNCKDLHFIKEIIEGVKNCSKHLKIDIRISLLEGIVSSETELKRKKKIIDHLVKMNLDMISFSNGLYDYDKQMIYPPAKSGFLPMYESAKFFLNQYPNMMWNLSGNVNDIEKIKNLSIHDNLSLSIGRPLIANPNFLFSINSESNQDWKIEKICNFCGGCHYYSNGDSRLSCPQYLKRYKKNIL